MRIEELCVNGERLHRTLEEFAAIGALASGGVDRPAFSHAEQQAQFALRDLLNASGLQTRIDSVGSVFGRRPGDDRPAILFGSHLDTVPGGGAFDGALGVLAGLEVLRVLQEHNIRTRHPLELVSFSAEEASRFGASTLGSLAMTAKLSAAALDTLRDASGVTAAEAMRAIGLDPLQLDSARWSPSDYRAFIELHIEQGRVLENSGKSIGAVTAIANSTRYQVTIEGCADHSGTTPMHLRRDAALAAAMIVLEVNRITTHFGNGVAVGTVGTLELSPGSISVIPGEARLGIDLRDIDGARKAAIAEAIEGRINEIAREQDVKIGISKIKDGRPISLDPAIRAAIEEAAGILKIPPMSLPSGAGHDAMNLAPFIPTGMIFIPSREGISHNPLEFSAPDQIERGANVLLHTILALDRSVE